MLSSVEQALVGREEIRAPLKTPAWEARGEPVGYLLGVGEDLNSGLPRTNPVARIELCTPRFSTLASPRRFRTIAQNDNRSD